MDPGQSSVDSSHGQAVVPHTENGHKVIPKEIHSVRVDGSYAIGGQGDVLVLARDDIEVALLGVDSRSKEA